MTSPRIYWGQVASAEQICEAFEVPRTVLADATLLFAAYDCAQSSGVAVVLYVQHGTLYLVEGSHCSCTGLRGQWRPEPTSWAALARRAFGFLDPHSRAACRALIQQHLGPPAPPTGQEAGAA